MTLTRSEYLALDATAMVEAVTAGHTTPAELHAAATEQHRATAAHIHAVVEWYETPSWGSVIPEPRENGHSGRLDGVPFLRKDYGSAEAGRLVECGSRLAAGVVAPTTDPLYERLDAAGATVVGRTAVPEFIQHGTTESRAFGVTRNPNAPEWSAGGSSGGAGAAVAAGVVPLAHASDCAGSIRIPAATCGLFGLKPSRRRVPWPDGGWGGIAEEFVVSRTIRDAQRAWGVLADRPTTRHSDAPPHALRVGLSTAHWSGRTPDPIVVAAAELVAEHLEAVGHEIVPIDGCPFDYDRSMDTWHACFSRWVAADVRRVAALTGRPLDATTLEPLTLGVIAAAEALTVDDLTAAQVTQGRISFQLDRAFDEIDVLLTPALGRNGIPLDWVHGELDSVDTYIERNDVLFPYSYVANLTGRPALVMPSGSVDEHGLPQGIQLLGNRGDDERLLTLAADLAIPSPTPPRQRRSTPGRTQSIS